jgi:opacity protein-like surface antigen
MTMRHRILSSTSVSLCSWLFAAFVCLGQDEGSVKGKSYFSLDIGPTLQSDLEVRSVAGDPADGVSINFDPGVRFDVGWGYHVTEHFGAELSLGIMYNAVDSVSGSGLGGFGSEVDLFQVPIMVNALYKVRSDIPIEPFFGVGLGGVFSVISNSSTSEDEFAFGYQGFLGLKYKLSSQTELTAVYKILGTTDLDFTAFETKGILAHTLALGFRCSF